MLARVKDEEREVGNFLEIVAQICFSLRVWALCFGTLSSWDRAFGTAESSTEFYVLKYFKVYLGL